MCVEVASMLSLMKVVLERVEKDKDTKTMSEGGSVEKGISLWVVFSIQRYL